MGVGEKVGIFVSDESEVAGYFKDKNWPSCPTKASKFLDQNFL
jgi:hypothetical protein